MTRRAHCWVRRCLLPAGNDAALCCCWRAPPLLLVLPPVVLLPVGAAAGCPLPVAAPCKNFNQLNQTCCAALTALAAETGEDNGGGEAGSAEQSGSGSGRAQGGTSSSRGGLEAKVDALQAELAEIKALLLQGKQQEKHLELGYGGGLEE